MVKTSYKNINELVDNIRTDLEKLDNGDLSLDDLDTLVQYGRDLNERLIILRFKAHDSQGGKVVFEPGSDVIEEQDEIVSFDLSNDEVDVEPIGVEQPIFDFDIPNVEEKAVEPEKEKAPKAESHQEINSSLNEIFKDDSDDSLRKKFQKSPITNLKSNISIANKFEYISGMFDGDGKIYDEAITELNNCKSGEEAKSKLMEYATSFDWDLEDKSILKFVELVERRYL